MILKWNDHVATDPTLLSRAIAATEIGSTAKVRLARGRDSEAGDKEASRAGCQSGTSPADSVLSAASA